MVRPTDGAVALGHLQPSNRTIIGVALLLFGAIVFGVGLHHMVATGTCSSTGYSANYGPVPHCPKGTGWWFAFLFGGVTMVVLGALMSGGSSVALLIPVIFSAIGIGALTVGFDSHAAHGAKTFGYAFGGAFTLFGVIPALVLAAGAVRRLGRTPAPPGGLGGASAFAPSSASTAFGTTLPEPDAILGAYAGSRTLAGSPLVSVPGASMPSDQPRGDVLDKIAKLSELHESGALTDDEFNRVKAKLLAEL